jgi:hypothetical protein
MLSIISSPNRYKQEYHGNGKNGWYGDTFQFILANDLENNFLIEQKSIRYSYRFHKTAVRINGLIPTAKTYRDFRNLISK